MAICPDCAREFYLEEDDLAIGDIVHCEECGVELEVVKLNELEPLLLCNQCGNKFHGHHLPDICPKCASVNVKAVNSTDMVLEGFEIEK